MAIIILLILILHFFVNQIQYLISRNVLFYFFGAILAAVIIYFLFQITYTADYDMYESFYRWEYDKTDILFYNLALYFKKNSYGFQNLFSLHMVLITLVYCLFILKFNNNIWYILGLYVMLLFIPYVNQIRYYLAFPCFLLAAYYLLYNRNLLLFGLFAGLGIISHSAIIILYIIFPVYLWIPEKYYKKILLVGSLILFVVSYFVSNSSFFVVLEHFGEYIKSENKSTVLGGIFSTLPTLTVLIPLYFLDRNYKGDRTNPEYVFLRKLSFFTTILLPASIFIQIIGFRYIFPFAIIWIIFFLYLIKDYDLIRKTRFFFISYLLVGLALYFQYGLPLDVLGESAYLKELTETINSIKNY